MTHHTPIPLKPVFRHTLVAVVMLFAVAPVLAEETFNGKGDVQVGQELYQTHCADCHGEHGRGDGSWAGAYEPPPSDLTREGLTGERLFIATRDGGMAVGMRATMPAFRHTLDDSSIHDIVAYIQSLSD